MRAVLRPSRRGCRRARVASALGGRHAFPAPTLHHPVLQAPPRSSAASAVRRTRTHRRPKPLIERPERHRWERLTPAQLRCARRCATAATPRCGSAAQRLPADGRPARVSAGCPLSAAPIATPTHTTGLAPTSPTPRDRAGGARVCPRRRGAPAAHQRHWGGVAPRGCGYARSRARGWGQRTETPRAPCLFRSGDGGRRSAVRRREGCPATAQPGDGHGLCRTAAVAPPSSGPTATGAGPPAANEGTTTGPGPPINALSWATRRRTVLSG